MQKKSILALVAVIGIFMTACSDDSSDPEDDSRKTKKFWAADMETEESYELVAQLLAIGSHCTVWVESSEVFKRRVTPQMAREMASTYDNEIYPKMINAFSLPPTTVGEVTYRDTMDLADRWAGDGDGKLCILLLDIRDSYDPPSNPSCVSGFFWDGNFTPKTEEENSNECDMIYIDTYPSLLQEGGLSSACRTLAHEMQHLMNFISSKANRDSKTMDTWIDEGLSSAAEYVMYGHEGSGRLEHYNDDPYRSIRNGNNFFVWDNHREDNPIANLDDYATVYLFFQWLRLQSGGTDIYKTIISSASSDYNAVVDAMGYDDWESLLKTWLAANYIMAPSGPYGYMNDEYFHHEIWGINAGTAPAGTLSIALYPGEGVYSVTESEGSVPTNGTHIRYAGLQKTGDELLSDTSIFAGGWQLTYNVNTNSGADEDNPPTTETGTTTGIAANVNVVRALSSRSVGIMPEGPYAISAREMLRRNGHKGLK